MHIYRATFYGANMGTFRTLIQAKDLKTASQTVDIKIQDGELFEVEGKGNRFVRVSVSNLVFVEYELLLNDSGLRFEEIMKFDDRGLKRLFEAVKDVSVLAVAFKPLQESMKNKLMDVLPESERDTIIREMQELRSVSVSEAYEAQNIIVDTAIKLLDKDEININKK